MRGEGRIKKLISQGIGNSRKRKFCEFLSTREFLNWLDNLGLKSEADFELVTFVNAESFPDLILSILSCISAIGKPRKWTLYMDDGFSEKQMRILEYFNFINTKKWNINIDTENKKGYEKKWQLRKFAAYAHHQLNGTTIFLDSDVLFYPMFKRYTDYFKEHNWYLPEPAEANNIDVEMGTVFAFKRQMYTVNAGFFIINTSPDWSLGFQYLDYSNVNKKDHYFLDQSALNLIYYHDKSARVLDPRVFHASANDHFWISALKTDKFAIRHYVGLIRHKMWQLGWKKYFN